ncbi:MAG: hypothetical protein OIF54_04840 [Cohaesibacter sp.]|nr:hypothetical protein [Cohaesibacter sp.]
MGDHCRGFHQGQTYEATVKALANHPHDHVVIKYVGSGIVQSVEKAKMMFSRGKEARKAQLEAVWGRYRWKVGDECLCLYNSQHLPAKIRAIHSAAGNDDPEKAPPSYTVTYDGYEKEEYRVKHHDLSKHGNYDEDRDEREKPRFFRSKFTHPNAAPDLGHCKEDRQRSFNLGVGDRVIFRQSQVYKMAMIVEIGASFDAKRYVCLFSGTTGKYHACWTDEIWPIKKVISGRKKVRLQFP